MAMHITAEQESAAKSVRRALSRAAKAGLHLRVFDGDVLLVTKAHLEDARYLESGMRDWKDEAIDVTGGIEADGGAGV
jgi:hypothetical protein